MQQYYIFQNKIIRMVCLVAILCFPSLLFAQPGFEEGVQDVPVDGGLSLLVAAGAAYGAKRLRKKP